MRCRTKKSSNSVCRKPHQSLSCHCIPISTLPHVVSAAFWPWKMEQTGVHQWLDPNTTFDHHFQHLHIFHIDWFIHLSFSRLRVEWARFEGFTEWVVKGLEWFQDFLGLQVVKWGQECETAEWQQVLHFFDFYFVSPTSTLGKTNMKIVHLVSMKNTWEGHKPGNSLWAFWDGSVTLSKVFGDLQLGYKKGHFESPGKNCWSLVFCQRSWLGSFAPILSTYLWTASWCNSPVPNMASVAWKSWKCSMVPSLKRT